MVYSATPAAARSDSATPAARRGHGLRRAPWELRYQLGARVATAWRRLVVQATHRHCRVELGPGTTIGPGFRLWIPEAGTLVVGEGVQFRRGFYCEIAGNGTVEIGDGSIFTADAMIQCSTSVHIGRRCVFGQSALIADGFHRFGDPGRHLLEQGYDFRPVHIDDGVVVTSKCTITASIGAGTLVGAHSVVSRPLPAHCLAVGAPARVVRSFSAAVSQPVRNDGARAR